jgi:hypothetical protein
MSRIRILAVLTALVLAALSTLVSVTPADAAGSRPKVGQCRTTTFVQSFSFSDSRRPVPCSSVHRMRTFAVIDIPKGVDYVHISGTRAGNIARRDCTKPFWRALGGGPSARAQTAYTWSFFGPTLKQRKAGARWIRCDVSLLATPPGANSVFVPLPHVPFPMIGSRPITDSTRRCLSDATHSYWTICSRAHAARADQTFTMATAWPSQATVDAAAATKCPGKRAYAPYPFEWKLGDHVITCYSVTTS